MTDSLPDPKAAIEKLLDSMGALEASDLHLKVGYPPCFRVHGTLRGAKMPPLPDSAYIEAMLREFVPESRWEEYRSKGALDFSASGGTSDRFRINMFRATGETHASIRRVLSVIPTFDQLNLPPIYPQIIEKCFEGLILVSGVTGCGKSTTLASMIEKINQHRNVHIITIEDPIEFVFQPKKSVISQREIGIDVADFHEALRYVLRQDPDCIMIGELRDRETVLAAIQAAETGHLVLGSMHIADTSLTLSRFLEFFPRAEHDIVRSSLAHSLKAVLCQRLLPGIEPGTRFPATEVLVNNPIVREKILSEKDSDLPDVIARSEEEGMHSFTSSLCALIESERVLYDTAMEFAPNRDALASTVKGIRAN